MNLEDQIIPVSDVDRAKGLHQQPGWRLDVRAPGSRVIGREEMTQQTADRQQVLTAWRSLPLEQQQALVEWYFNGASVAMVADTLGVPSDTVRSRIYCALRYLARTT